MEAKHGLWADATWPDIFFLKIGVINENRSGDQQQAKMSKKETTKLELMPKREEKTCEMQYWVLELLELKHLLVTLY